MKKIFTIYFLLSFVYSLTFSQTMTSTGQLNVPRWMHQAQLLPNGQVLAFGGDNGDYVNLLEYRSAELYNPVTGLWTFTGNMNEIRADFASVLLNNGKVLAIGGEEGGISNTKRSCEQYDPASGTWSYVDSMNYPRSYHDAIKLKNGNVLVVGGGPCEIYNPDNNTWSLTGNTNVIGGGFSLVMLNDGRILATGGDDNTTSKKAEIYDPSTGIWTTVPNDMNGQRNDHSSVLLNDGRVLLTGSVNSNDQKTAEIFDPVSNTFTSVGFMQEGRATSPAILMDNGKVLAFGLGDFFSPSDTKLIEVYDPATSLWNSNVYNQIGTQGYTIHKLGNGKILVVGGSNTTGNGASNGCVLIDQGIGPCIIPNLGLSATGGIGCSGNSGSINIIGGESGVAYQAYLSGIEEGPSINGPGNMILNIQTASLKAGNNVVNILVKKSGCPSFLLNDTALVFIYQPQIIPSGKISVCQGDSIILNAPSGFTNYTWSSGQSTQSIKVKTAGSYSVQVNNGPCLSPYSPSIQVSLNPLSQTSLSISITNGSNPTSLGTPVTFTASSLNGGTNPIYEWKINGVSTLTNSNIFTTSSLNNNDQISCLMTSNAICPNPITITSDTITMIMSANPGILSVIPAANSINIPESSNVSINFSQPMSSPTASNSSINIFSSFRGSLSGIYSGGTTSNIVFDPNLSFYPGEKVSVSVSTNAKSTNNLPIIKPFVYNFKTKAEIGPATFHIAKPNVTVNQTPWAIALADFDGDGDIDMASGNRDVNSLSIRMNDGTGVFSGGSDINSWGGSFVVAADFDSDSDVDILTFNGASDFISILKNDGAGNFTLNQINVNFVPNQVASCVADFDGDGDIDIALVNAGYINNFAIIKNNGTGGFSTENAFPLNNTPRSITSLDADKDGDMDLAITNYDASSVSIRLNDGTGVFSGAQDIPVDVHPVLSCAEDFDGDGDIDIATGNSNININTNKGSISIIKNDGAGNFTGPVNVKVGSYSTSMCSADIDGDGDLDLITANGTSGTDRISIVKNDGLGNFSDVADLNMGVNPRAICSADFDNDGDMDLAFTNSSSNYIYVRLNHPPSISTSFTPSAYYCAGSKINVNFSFAGIFNSSNIFTAQLSDSVGNFTSPLTVGSGNSTPLACTIPLAIPPGTGYRIRVISSNPVTIGSENGLNIYIPNCPSVNSVIPSQNALNVTSSSNIGITFSDLMNTSTSSNSVISVDGSFTGRRTINNGGTYNGAGSKDIVFNPTSDFYPGERLYVTINNHAQNTNGIPMVKPFVYTFTASAALAPGSFTLSSNTKVLPSLDAIFSADLNNDGYVDVISNNMYNQANLISILINNKSGGFLDPINNYIPFKPTSASGADIDADGDIDLIFGSDLSYSILIFINTGNGNFSIKPEFSIGTGAYSIFTADFNGDGYIDISTANPASSSIIVLLNDGFGNFKLTPQKSLGAQPMSIYGGDIDKDGDLDIVTANSNNNTVSILKNNGDGSFSSLVSIGVGSNPQSVYMADLDGDTDLDILTANTASNNISVLINNGSGNFTLKNNIPIGSDAWGLVTTDFDGDGDLDICTSNYNSGSLSQLTNDGMANFSNLKTLLTGYNISKSISSADFDNDGDMDIAVANTGGNMISLFLNGPFLSNQCDSNICLGGNINIPYSCSANTFNPGNIFTAQLSDPNGSFASPINLSNPLSSTNSGYIHTTIPTGLSPGNNYRIRVVASNPSFIGYDNGVSLVLTSNPPAQPSAIIGPNSGCTSNQNYIQNYKVSSVTGVYHTWTLTNMNGGSTIQRTGDSIQVFWITSGTYTLSCTPSNGCGVGPSRSLNINVFDTPAYPGTITIPALHCSDTYGSYSISNVVGATDYTWTYPTGWSASGNTANINIFASTNAIAGLLTVTANNSCGSSIPSSINLNLPQNIPLQPGIISTPGIQCVGEYENYSISSIIGATSYTWTYPIGWSGSGNTNNINILASVSALPGQISVTANNGCGSSAASSVTLSLFDLPKPTISILGNTLSTSSSSGLSYQWILNGVNTGTNSSIYQANTSGNYQVIITDLNNGCSDTSDISLFTYTNPSGIVNSPLQSDIKIYPNPTENIFNVSIETQGVKEAEIIIENTLGIKVFSQIISGIDGTHVHQVNLSEYGEGIYFVRVKVGNETYTRKLVLN